MLDQFFGLGSLLAMVGWVALAAAPLLPRLKPHLWRLAGLVIPLVLGLAYLVLFAAHWGGSEGGFGSLADVRALFDTPGLLLAGWFHYLAFDLFVGTWIARDGERAGVSHLALLPCFAATFLLGPVGFLLYLLIRFLAARPDMALAEAKPKEG